MKLRNLKKKLLVIPMSFSLCFSNLITTAYAVGAETSAAEKGTSISEESSVSGLKNIDGKWYYVNSDGTKKETGWLSDQEKEEILKDTSGKEDSKDTEEVEEKPLGWQKVNGKLYYYTEEGQYKETGWFEEKEANPDIDDEKEYYLDKDFSAVTGWKEIGRTWFYFDESGVLQKGWVQDNYNWYYLDDSGAMKTGWIKVDGRKYYLNESGAMVIGKKYIDNKWMFFDNGGALQTGFYFHNGIRYYSTKEGEMVSNKWITVNNKEYYIKADSSVAVGDIIIDGKMHSFDKVGKYLGRGEMVSDDLYIKYLNVGNADCAFIKLPSGETALIDTGEPASSKKLVEFLDSQKLSKEDGKKVIDYVILTHGHSDHIGGLTAVLENFKVNKVYMPENAGMKDWLKDVERTKENASSYDMLKEDYRVYQEMIKYLEKNDIEVTKSVSGEYIDKDKILKFIQADKDFGPIGSDKLLEDYWALNDRSSIVYLDYADLQVLFTGDIEWTAEKDFWVNKLLGNNTVDVLKVPHHGHNTSSTLDFLTYVNPKLGVISRAEDKIEKNKAYNNLLQAGVTIFETSLNDGISVYATTKNWNLQ